MPVKKKAEMQAMLPQLRNAWDASKHQKLRERPGIDYPSEASGGTHPPTPWSQMPSLQNCETISFCG